MHPIPTAGVTEPARAHGARRLHQQVLCRRIYLLKAPGSSPTLPGRRDRRLDLLPTARSNGCGERERRDRELARVPSSQDPEVTRSAGRTKASAEAAPLLRLYHAAWEAAWEGREREAPGGLGEGRGEWQASVIFAK